MNSSVRSLRKTLTSRLLIWQLAGLLAVAISSGFIFFYMDDYTGARFNLQIAETLADAVTDEGGVLALSETDTLKAVRQNSPQLWFAIRDNDGRLLQGGNIPPRMVPLVDTIGDLTELQIVGVVPSFNGAILSFKDSAVGQVRVLFGGSTPPDLLAGMLAFAGNEVGPLLAAIVVVIGGLTIYAVPRVVGSALSSLQAVERVASQIDIEQRGVRLPSEAVPAEVAALVNAVNAALIRLDEGYAEKQRFLADAAHELRTPIAILQGRLELAPKGDLERRLLLDVHRLSNLAEQLLDLQRVEHQQRPYQTVDMVALSRQVIADLSPLAISAGYEPVFASAVDNLPILGDASSLERAIINLVQNAIIHGGNRGEITVAVNAERSIAISDAGPGIPEDRRDWIFEPFHRLRPLNHGSGLGLSLVREIMRRHHGTISVEASETGGARFVLRFEGSD